MRSVDPRDIIDLDQPVYQRAAHACAGRDRAELAADWLRAVAATGAFTPALPRHPHPPKVSGWLRRVWAVVQGWFEPVIEHGPLDLDLARQLHDDRHGVGVFDRLAPLHQRYLAQEAARIGSSLRAAGWRSPDQERSGL